MDAKHESKASASECKGSDPKGLESKDSASETGRAEELPSSPSSESKGLESKGLESKDSASETGRAEEFPSSSSLVRVKEGFSINSMNMRDALTGELQWESGTWDSRELFESTYVVDAQVPCAILACKAVSREINFSSTEEIRNFRLEQKVGVTATQTSTSKIDLKTNPL